MILLGLLLLAATGAFTGLAIADNLHTGQSTTMSILGHDVATMTPLAVFLSGAALALICCLGLALVAAGLVRARRHRSALSATEQELSATRKELRIAEKRAAAAAAAQAKSEPARASRSAGTPAGVADRPGDEVRREAAPAADRVAAPSATDQGVAEEAAADGPVRHRRPSFGGLLTPRHR
ncbi:hypothetical protein [Streptomyces tateyamensis]|uniref:hypothetical protein n=1 Tax=Streptomyces tateyamensis TaxID=565073 RepID=UPI0015E89E1A|nr:hypothetical protein [Streptomyces tateyamensis]